LGAALGVTRKISTAAHDWMALGVEAARRAAPKPSLRGICFVWRDPWIAAGGDTYVSEVLAACGVENMMTNRSRYPKFDLSEAHALRPDVIVLPSEPYPFGERDLPSVPGGVLVDGTVLCWYGPRTGRIAELATLMAACAISMPSPR